MSGSLLRLVFAAIANELRTLQLLDVRDELFNLLFFRQCANCRSGQDKDGVVIADEVGTTSASWFSVSMVNAVKSLATS